ncbi:MAG: dephospho-CoA kinase [Candidatus Cloacimonetes bacterium]|nr:dephospho-CoA kinase [Candidatus Cloacimonadota bacterium]MDD4559764.1 dephospho-CoA kinase [Candidatus Cloacimonadota bacterium]
MNIGITGNIGSGKSSFCACLEALGYKVYYADLIANRMLPELSPFLRKRWGDAVFSGQNPDRLRIAEIVFNQPQELAYLNSILHPLVVAEVDRLLSEPSAKARFFEIPLLFEASLEDRFDFIVLVRSPLELVIERIKQRNPDSWENQIKRLEQQMPDYQKATMVDMVIENDEDLEKLKNAAVMLIEQIEDLNK